MTNEKVIDELEWGPVAPKSDWWASILFCLALALLLGLLWSEIERGRLETRIAQFELRLPKVEPWGGCVLDAVKQRKAGSR